MTARRRDGVAAVLAGALLAACSPDRSPAHQPDEPAALACASLVRLEQMVVRDAAAKDVLALLDKANAASDKARDTDPRWVQLASAVDVLDEAIRSDRGQDVSLALRLIDKQCAATVKPPRP